MTREDLWRKIIKKNPKLMSDPHFTSAGFRKLFVTVWDHGFRHGEESNRPTNPPLRSSTYGVFDQIFGSRGQK
jgi:hypothetical protein